MSRRSFARVRDVLGQPDVYPDLSATVSQKASELAVEYGFTDVEDDSR